MKDKIITTSIIVVILSLFWVFTTPLRANISRQKDILNFVNLKKFHNIDKNCMKELKQVQELAKDTTSYNISDIVTDYIIKCEGAVPYKQENSPTYFKDTTYTTNSDSKISKQGLSRNCSWLLDYITNYHVKHKETFTEDLVANLEDKLDHRSKEITKDWYISTQIASASCIQKNDLKKEFLISIPFGCYIEYQSQKVIPLNRNYVSTKNWKKIKDRTYQITLVDNNGAEYLCGVSFNNKGLIHKNDMTIDIYGIIVKYNQASVNLYSPDQIELENSIDSDTQYD